MKLSRTLMLLASVAAGSLACSEDAAKTKSSDDVIDSGTEDSDPMQTVDASDQADTGTSADSGVAMMPDAMMPRNDAGMPGVPANLVVKSNLTGVTFKQDAEDNEGLRITSFAYYQDAPNSAGYYTNFYIGVKNFGSKLLCFPNAQLSVKGAGGTPLFENSIYVESDTRYESFGSLIKCLAPGQESVGWTNDLPSTGTAASLIREVSFDLTVDVRDLKPVEGAPKLVSATAYDRFGTGNAAFMGTVKVGAKGMEGPAITFYVRDAGGYFRDQGKANQVAGLAPGAEWAFASTACRNTSVALASDTLPIIDYRFAVPKSRSHASTDDAALLADIAAFESARENLRQRAAE